MSKVLHRRRHHTDHRPTRYEARTDLGDHPIERSWDDTRAAAQRTERLLGHFGRRRHPRRVSLEGSSIAGCRRRAGAAGDDIDAVLAQFGSQTLAEDGVERLAGCVAGDSGGALETRQ